MEKEMEKEMSETELDYSFLNFPCLFAAVKLNKMLLHSLPNVDAPKVLSMFALLQYIPFLISLSFSLSVSVSLFFAQS